MNPHPRRNRRRATTVAAGLALTAATPFLTAADAGATAMGVVEPSALRSMTTSAGPSTTPPAVAATSLEPADPWTEKTCSVPAATRATTWPCWKPSVDTMIVFDATGSRTGMSYAVAAADGRVVTKKQGIAHPTTVWLAAGETLSIWQDPESTIRATISAISRY